MGGLPSTAAACNFARGASPERESNGTNELCYDYITKRYDMV